MLNSIAWKEKPNQDDLLTLTYHLFLQDRIEQALHFFSQLKREKISAKMQYDYMHCYALFYQEKPSKAAKIAEPWKTSQSTRWRQRFTEVTRQAHEIDQSSRQQPAKKSNSDEAKPRSLRLAQSKGGLSIQASGIKQATLRLYSVDLEVLFSEKPFLDKQNGSQPSIEPNQTMIISINADDKEQQVKLPEKLRHGNALAMVEADDLRQVLALESHAHIVSRQKIDKTLKITRSSDGKPLPRCYVKIYVETSDGKTAFFKDGYTDLRGLFPYEAHTSIAPHKIKRYSIFTSHPKLGSKITNFR